jgi:predicted DNA-binding transcriptional regulator AlpA
MPKTLLRPPVTADRLGISLSLFWKDFVRTGRLRAVPVGKRRVGFLESEVDQLIDELAELRDRPKTPVGRPRLAKDAA